MPIFGSLDVGRSVLTQGPSSGQDSGSIVIQGSRTISWSRAGKSQVRSMVVNVQAPVGIGGAAAYSRAATAYAVQQLTELASNPDLNPVYVQWWSGDGILVPNNWDGWYRLDDVTPLEWRWDRHVPCQVTATFIAPTAPRRLFISSLGAALSSNYSGAATNLISLPVGSTAMEASVTRNGGDGSIPCIVSPVGSPEPLVLSTTISQIFQGGVRVYDTIA